MANKLFYIFTAILFLAAATFAQTASFTFQGKLNDGTNAASGTYQFQFKLYDANGVQIGQTLSDIAATVTNGIFAVNLDFGAASYDGAARFIEVGVRPNCTVNCDGVAYTALSPRQAIASTPYAVKSLNAQTADNSAKLGGVSANQFVQTGDARLSDARVPLPGSDNYIRNSQFTQPDATFILGGSISGGAVNSGTDYKISSNRVLSVEGMQNVFVGVDSGKVTTGHSNAFFGASSGRQNSFGFKNSFFGFNAGRSNTGSANNAFFGTNAGYASTGNSNSFFGSGAGLANGGGANNTFVGADSGRDNVSGSDNVFIGYQAAQLSTQGNGNIVIGSQSYPFLNAVNDNNIFIGRNTTGVGLNNTVIGYQAALDNSSGIVSNSVALGANAHADESNMIALGAATAKVRIAGNLTVFGSSNVGNASAQTLRIFNPASSGSVSACFVPNGSTVTLANCSSSLRYKDNVQNYAGGLDVVKRLRPVTFDWKSDGSHDVGFVAEEVNAVEPLLSTFNKNGQIEGVKYAQITTALVNAVKEQNAQIENQRIENQNLKAQIDALKALVCAGNQSAAICQPEK